MTTYGDGTVGPQNRAGATKGEFMTDPSSTPKRTRRGETAAIVPSETKPARQKPMTDEEFEVAPVSTGPTERQIDYTRMCRSCHRQYDKRRREVMPSDAA